MPKAPYTWTKEVEDRILCDISTIPRGVKKILKKCVDYPSQKEFLKHLREDENFRSRYALAKQSQIGAFGEELFNVIFSRGNDKRESGMVHVQRDRLIADKIQWYMTKLTPKIFGDGVIKKLPVQLDLKKSFEDLSQQLIDNLAKDVITLDEANSAFAMLKNYAELTKITEFEKRLEEIKSQLNAAQNGVKTNGKEIDEKSKEGSI